MFDYFQDKLTVVEKDINDIRLKMSKSAKLFDCFLQNVLDYTVLTN